MVIGWALSFLLLGATMAAPAVHAQGSTSRESQIKAAYLYNFARLADWPDDGGLDRAICVLGDSPVGDALRAVDGKIARGRTVTTRAVADITDSEDCDILFVSSSEADGVADIIASASGWSMLTVGEVDDFAEAGGMIAFHFRRNRIGLKLNLAAVQRAGLSLSSELLAVSSIVR